MFRSSFRRILSSSTRKVFMSNVSDESREKVRKSLKNRSGKYFFNVGVPMLLFLLAGMYFLTEFLSTNVEMNDKRVKSSTEKQFSIEEEYNAMMKNLNINDYSLSKIPDPDDVENTKVKRVKDDNENVIRRI